MFLETNKKGRFEFSMYSDAQIQAMSISVPSQNPTKGTSQKCCQNGSPIGLDLCQVSFVDGKFLNSFIKEFTIDQQKKVENTSLASTADPSQKVSDF